MIISRAPLRITLGGGGTDLPFYYKEGGGFLLSAAINRYMYIVLHDRSIEDTIKLKYSKTETVVSTNQIEHKFFKHILKKYGIEKSIEITSIADVGAGTGLGSSGAFTVALLNAIHKYKGIQKTRKEFAEEACEIEMELSSAGKQDTYIAVYGGIRQFTVDEKGEVDVKNAFISEETIDKLEKNILLFFTGYSRSADQILEQQKNNPEKLREYYDSSYSRGRVASIALVDGDMQAFADTLNAHWKQKKKFAENTQFDSIYKAGISAGALGGKLQGAGGGGFFMFYCEEPNQKRLREKMAELGLKEMTWRLDLDGAKLFQVGE